MTPHFTSAEINQFDGAIGIHYGHALEHMTKSQDSFHAAVIIIPCMIQKLKQIFPMEIDCGYSPINVGAALKSDSAMLRGLYTRASDLAMKHMLMLTHEMDCGDGYAAYTRDSMTDITNLNILIHALTFKPSYTLLRDTVIELYGKQTWNDIVGSYMYHVHQPDITR